MSGNTRGVTICCPLRKDEISNRNKGSKQTPKMNVHEPAYWSEVKNSEVSDLKDRNNQVNWQQKCMASPRWR